MLLTNDFILAFTNKLSNLVVDDSARFPAKIAYILQRNFKTLFPIFEEAHRARLNICETYCTSKENDTYHFEDKDKLAQANKELQDLMNVQQEVNILKFKIEDLGDMQFTGAQMDVLMQMIEDGEE